MNTIDIINKEFILAQRRTDAQKSLSDPLCLCALVAKKNLPPGHQGTKLHQAQDGISINQEIGLLKSKRVSLTIFMFISFLFSLFHTISGFSQSDSLNKYLDIAAKNNPTVLQRFNEFQAALQKIPQVGSLSDPELSVGVFLSPMELVNGNQVADIRLMQMFPWFGVLRYGKDEMSLMAKAKLELLRDTRLQVIYDVQRTWFDLYKVQKNIDISEKNVEILKTIERLAIVKYSSVPSASSSSGPSSLPVSAQTGNSGSQGMQTMGSSKVYSSSASANQSSPAMPNNPMGTASGITGLSDIYRIQIETGDLENSIALLRNQQITLTALFNSYLNRSATSPLPAIATLAVDSLDLSVNSVPDSIMANSPMLGMLEYERESAEARKKMVTRMGYPMVGLGINYSVISKSALPMGLPEMNGKDMIMPMVVVTLPIYRKKYKAMQEEADLSEAATLQNYRATSNSLQVEYYQAVQLYQDAQRRMKLYDNQYQLTSKSLDLTLGRFSVSASELSEVLRLRQQTLDYEFKQVEAIADFNTSIAWLKRLMAYSQTNKNNQQ